MSFGRIFSLFSKPGLREFNFNFKEQLKLAPFAFLAWAQSVEAIDTFGKFIPNNTQFKLSYAFSNFPQLADQLRQYCSVILFSEAQTVYEQLSKSPQCFSPEGDPGPSVSVSLQIGQVLSDQFKDCLNTVMDKVCNEFYGTNSPEPNETADKAAAYAIFGVGAIAVMGCICVCLAKACSDSCSKTKEYTRTPTSETTQLNVQVNDNCPVNYGTHSDHHHDHHHDDDHHEHSVEPKRATVRWT